MKRFVPGPIWAPTLIALAVLALSGWGIARLTNPLTGMGTIALVLLLMHLADRRHLNALRRWLIEERPLPGAPGVWDEVFGPIYRKERAAAARLAAQTRTLENMRRAAQALPDGVVTLDRGQHITALNQRATELLNLDAQRDAGQSITNLVRHPDFLTYLAQDTWDQHLLLRQRGLRSTPDRVLLLQIVAYGDGEKLLLVRDVTQFERLETMRRDFVANVSHELKTPLTVLSGFLETLCDMPLDAEQTRQYLALMRGQAQRMENLVADLLTLSALEANNPHDEQQVDMGRLTERLAATAAQLSDGRHTLHFDIAPHLDLQGAEGEIASALSNLVTNAVRYTPDGGAITVRWARDAEPGGGARFTVTDTGIGIESAHIPRLTERFYRVDRGRSREAGGTGLGLAIVKHVLSRHQARLDVSSTVGVGSCFTAIFPPERLVEHAKSKA